RTASPQPAVGGEPWIGEAGLAEAALSDEPVHEDADAHEAGPGPLQELPTLVIQDDDPRLALKALWDAQPPEPTLIDPEVRAVAETPAALEAAAPVLTSEPLLLTQEPATAPSQAAEPVVGAGPAQPAMPDIPGAEGVGGVR